MDLEMLKNLAEAGESAAIEFKKSTADLQGACESLCGMLNAGGIGRVIIGVAGGKLIGQKITDRTQQEIAQCIREFTPDPQIQLSIVPFQGQLGLILLEGQSSAKKMPYFYRGKAYLRVGTTTSLLSRDRLQALFEEQYRQRHHYDHLHVYRS